MNVYDLSFAPFTPWPVLAAAGAVGLIAGFILLYRRGIMALPRLFALALVLMMLANPALVREEREPQKGIVAVVVDRSPSQDLSDRKAQTDEALAGLRARLEALGAVETRVIEASGAADDKTLLFDPLRKALADVPPERVAGAILITDGQVHDIPANVSQLGFKAPLHALIAGRAKERDRRIELTQAPRFGIVGKDARFQARVEDVGGTGAPARLIVRRDGVEIARLNAHPGGLTDIAVKIEHGGANVVEFETESAPGELTERNNKVVAVLDGVRDKLKVLLVSGEPHAGERAWRNLLRSDANVDLIHFTILRQPDKLDAIPVNELSLIAFPTAELFGRKIKDFDLVIFDRYSNQRILQSAYLENIVRYVRAGGALLLAVGPDFAGDDGIFYSPLGEIAPGAPTGEIITRPFKPQISKDGAKHPVTRDLAGANAAPWSDWFRQIVVDQTRGVDVMAGADGKPLLILSREGKGRVAELLSDQIWLWARGYEGGGPYADLLRRLAHWLMKEPDLEEEALRAKAQGQTIHIQRQTLSEADESVTIQAPSGAQTQMRLEGVRDGLARGAYTAPEMGLYKLQSGALSVLVNVGADNPVEFRNVLSSPEPLRAITEASGGSVRRIEASGSHATLPRLAMLREGVSYGGSDWVGLRQTNAYAIRAIGVTPLGLGLPAMAALLLALIAAWFAEGREGKIFNARKR